MSIRIAAPPLEIAGSSYYLLSARKNSAMVPGPE